MYFQLKMDLLTEVAQADQLNQVQLKTLLDQLAEAYHSGIAIVDDVTFDALQDLYESKFEAYTQIGAEPRGEIVIAPYFLSSLNKIKTEPELTRWLSKYAGPYVLEDKVDGLTLLYVSKMEQGRRIYKLYTRGRVVENANRSMDVSHAIPYLNLPQVQYDLAVRGEIVIYKETFAQIGAGFKNPRNMVSGIFTRKDSFDPNVATQLHFLAFRVVAVNVNGQMQAPETTPETQIMQLRQVGFETPWAVVTENITVEELAVLYKQRQEQAPYEIDGIVIYQNAVIDYPVGDDPKQAVAFKMPGETAVTRVIQIQWQASKDRRLVPVVIYEPVILSGATISRALGDNARYIIEHKIGSGTIIEVVRSGEVIPRVVKVITPAVQADMPNADIHGAYYYDGVDFILNQDNAEVKAAKMQYFVKKLGVENLGPGRVAVLVQNGIFSIAELLKLTPEQWSSLPGIGNKLANSIYFDLQAKIQDVPLYKIMAASGVFSGFAEKRLRQIVQAYPNILQYAGNPQLPMALQQLGGFQELAYQFAEKLPEFVQWLQQHAMITIVLPENPVSNTLENITVVFSGFRDKELEEQIRRRGGKVTTSVSRNTSLLVVKDPNDITSKPQKAMQLGIPIVQKEQFIKEYLV